MSEVLLFEVGVAIAALAVAATIAYRIGLSVIPAYIIIGVLFSPNKPFEIGGFSTSLVEYMDFIDVLAELGIVFLLFFLGLEFSLTKLVEQKRKVLGIGAVDFGVNFTVGLVIGLVAGWTVAEALFLAGIVYISSSSIITKSLLDEEWILNPESDTILSTLVVEDIVIAVYLAMLSGVVLGGSTLYAAAVDIGVAVVFLGILTVCALYGGGVMQKALQTDSDEVFLLRVMATVTLIAGSALLLGVSEAVAAFFVGTTLSQTTEIDRIERIVSPLKDFFAAIFFFTIGIHTNLIAITGVLGLVALTVVVSIGGKLVSGYVSARIDGLTQKQSVNAGIGLVPRGEFSLVISTVAMTATGSAVLQTTIPALTVGYVLVMSIVGTLMIQHAGHIRRVIGVHG